MSSARVSLWLRRVVPAAAVVVLLAGQAMGNKMLTICVDFNNATNNIKDSDGNAVTSVASGLNAAAQTAVMDKIRQKYEAKLGAGNVTVMAGAVTQANPTGGCDYGVVISGGKAPAGREYGDAGGTGPSFVYLGQFNDQLFNNANVGNYAGETAAHEVGHRLGIGHNSDNPPSLMTDGGKVGDDPAVMNQTNAQKRALAKTRREADNRGFTADDSKKIVANKPKRGPKAPKPNVPRPENSPGQFYYWGGHPITLATDPLPTDDDSSFSALVSTQSSVASTLEVGYFNVNNDFFFQSDSPSAGLASGVDMPKCGALIWCMTPWLHNYGNGFLYDFNIYGKFMLADVPNPNDPNFFLRMTLGWDLNLDGTADTFVTYDSTGEDRTGGYVPTPGSAALLAMAGGLVGRRRRRA